MPFLKDIFTLYINNLLLLIFYNYAVDSLLIMNS